MAAVSIFAAERSRLFVSYRVRLELTGKLMGGVPRDPKIIEGWIRSKAGVEDAEEVRRMLLRTLVESGADVSEGDSYEDLVAASEAVAAERSTCGFKRDEAGPYIEARQLKAAIKESVNVLFAGGRWGKTKKGPKNYTAERLFVRGMDPEHPERIHLGIPEPDGIEMVIGHVSGPQGQRSTLGYHEYAERRAIEFLIDSTDAKAGTAGAVEDSIAPEHWPLIWMHSESNGLGALRSQGHGQFAVTAFERV